MDLILTYLDQSCLDALYISTRETITHAICPRTRLVEICATVTDPSVWRRDSPHRQALSIFLFLWLCP